MISEQDLASALQSVGAEAAGRVEGIFGPASITWRIDREAVVFLGAGRALLLQLAHPWVAAAIAEHSRTLDDPIGRFHRTFDVMFTMVFGSLDDALAAARRLHRRHASIVGRMPEAAGRFEAGSMYYANEAAALRWVQATLVDTALLAHDLVLPPLSIADREQYWRESRVFGGLFGLRAADLPPDWTAFVAYKEAMLGSDILSVSTAGREIAHHLFAGPRPWMRVPRWYQAVTANLLPERLRRGFELPFGEAERQRAGRALKWIRRLYPALPNRLRHVGPYQEALARLAGKRRLDLATRSLNRAWIGRPAIGDWPVR